MKSFSEIPSDILAKTGAMHEDFFDTEHNPDEMPVTEETDRKLTSLTPYWLNYATDDNGEPISSVVVMPTQKKLADEFLSGEITERELMDKSLPSDSYDAAYLCALVTLPHHRGKGIMERLVSESLNTIPLTEDAVLFSWPTTDDGKRWMEKHEDYFGKRILLRKKI